MQTDAPAPASPPGTPSRRGNPPTLSQDQLRRAREQATAARRHRAEMKTAVKQGRATLRQAIELSMSDDVIAHIKVIDLLKSVPRVGQIRAVHTMKKFDIAENRRLRGLGPHQIAGLLKDFE